MHNFCSSVRRKTGFWGGFWHHHHDEARRHGGAEFNVKERGAPNVIHGN
jgi:hypothetical protein